MYDLTGGELVFLLFGLTVTFAVIFWSVKQIVKGG
jgi:hypothetical protein